MRTVAQGDVVGGQFRLISELGHGGMGTVWLADHLRLHSHVAVKIIDPVIAMDPQAVPRFLREARTAAALRSPHIVQILDYGVDGERPYIAMEMLDGESLAERLQRDERLSVLETARVIRHVARALGRAHDAGIVHRDLKPENIFVVKNDDEVLIKVLDFGIAKARPVQADQAVTSLATRTGALMGTPHFMSPEQAEALASVDFRSDIWALGVVAFECLVGELPFKGNSVTQLVLAICRDPLPVPSQIRPVLAGFDAWFARACARNPGERFESAKQAADAFEQLEPVALAPASVRSLPAAPNTPSDALARNSSLQKRPASGVSRWTSRSRGPLAILAGVLLLGGVRLATDPFRGAEAEAVSKPLLPASAPPAPATASLPTASPQTLTAVGGAASLGGATARTAYPVASPQVEPPQGGDPAAKAGSPVDKGLVHPARAGGAEPRAKGERVRRVRKAPRQATVVPESTSKEKIDLGF